MTQRMNPKVKKLWVAALRSGEYQQGRSRLRSADNKFCCLGVLCNLHAKAHPAYAARQTNPVEYGGSAGLPPNVVVKWAGLPSWNPGVHRRGGWATPLSRCNDIYRMTFAQIADLIEEQL